MKFEKLTDTQIKIILSLQDMESNNISVENVLSNSADSQKLLETMISQAEKELGFKPEDSKLLIEAIPSNEECIFTITKILDEAVFIPKHINNFIYKFSYLCLKDISRNFSLIYYNCTYYLSSTNENTCLVIDYIKALFSEFGKDVSNSPGIEGKLNEYGKVLLSKNAILKCIHSFTKNKL